MSNPFQMVIAIVALIALVKVARMYFHNQRLQRETPQPDQLTQRKIAQLEERVRVLETIVTDKQYDLRREIDRL